MEPSPPSSGPRPVTTLGMAEKGRGESVRNRTRNRVRWRVEAFPVFPPSWRFDVPVWPVAIEDKCSS